MHYFIGLDDTDNHESRGTGHLARLIAGALAQDFQVHGVIRHQLLDDERVPKTEKNSCAAVLFEGESHPLEEIAKFGRKLILDGYNPGSDPGLCLASAIPTEVIAFGQRARTEFLYPQEARRLAGKYGILLEGLGGDEGGVIGALAAVGLAASGSDGRYVLVGAIRELAGLHTIADVLAAGIVSVKTLDGETITDGLVLADKMRPARREGQPVLFVERQGDHWLPLKLD